MSVSNTESSKRVGWVWWCSPVIQAFRKLRQKDYKFEAILAYITRSCLNIICNDSGHTKILR